MEDLSPVLSEYYETIGVIPNNTRQEDQVFARSAMMVVMRDYMTLMQIGRIFDRNHASVLHAIRNHEDNYNWSKMYQFFYATAKEVWNSNPTKDIQSRNKLVATLTRHKMRIQELEAEVDKLKNNNKELFENCRILQKENKNLSQYADRV
jgi:DNA-binding transcriptional MerR regulator